MHVLTPVDNTPDLSSAPYDGQGEPAARVGSVSRSVGCALVQGSEAGWRKFPVHHLGPTDDARAPGVGVCRLGPEDAGEVIARFTSLLPEAKELVAAASGAGFPYVLPAARFWAAKPSDRERKAFCLASFEAMSPERRAAFVGFANHGAAG